MPLTIEVGGANELRQIREQSYKPGGRVRSRLRKEQVVREIVHDLADALNALEGVVCHRNPS